MRSFVSRCAAVCFFIGALLLQARGDDIRMIEGKGTVRKVLPESQDVVIRHEALPGYLSAMTLSFQVGDKALLEGLSPGDEVAFTLSVKEAGDEITALKIRQKVQRAAAETSSGPLKAGDSLSLDGLNLVDQDGKTFDSRSVAGRPLVIAFFFTRCPLPDMCPLLSAKLMQVQDLLKSSSAGSGPGTPRILSISVDPAHDTPAVLKSYAEGYKANPAVWTFLTGSQADLRTLALRCRADFWDEDGLIKHTLSVVVVDAGGKARRMMEGSGWSAANLAEALLDGAIKGSR